MVPDPASPVVDADSGRPPSMGAISRLMRGIQAVGRETGWLLKQLGLGAGRCAVSIWSVARQRRLEDKRSQALQSLGEELRKGDLAASMPELLVECDRYEREVREHRDALASTTPRPGLLARVGRGARLSKARAAQREVFRKLGEGGLSLVSPEQREPLLALDAAISSEQARRARLTQPWRSLPLPRRIAISAIVVLLAGAAVALGLRAWKPPAGGGTAGTVAAADETTRRQGAGSEALPESRGKTAVPNAQERKQNAERSALDFAQRRKAATPGQWFAYAANPVLSRGDLNQWDDFEVGSPVVLKEGDRYRMWYRGCHFLMREYACGVGQATSTDGMSWTKSPKPVLVPRDARERRRLRSLTVVRANDRYLMWYSADADPFVDAPYATIHLAISNDGLTWEQRGPVVRAMSRRTGAFTPTALYDGKLFHLWYTDHYPTENDMSLLHSTSADGAQWTLEGVTSLADAKAAPRQLSVFADGSAGYRAIFALTSSEYRRLITYVSREEYARLGAFGRLVSVDGTQWETAKGGTFVAMDALNTEHGNVSTTAALVSPDGLTIWFGSIPESGAEDIRLIFLKEGGS